MSIYWSTATPAIDMIGGDIIAMPGRIVGMSAGIVTRSIKFDAMSVDIGIRGGSLDAMSCDIDTRTGSLDAIPVAIDTIGSCARQCGLTSMQWRSTSFLLQATSSL